MDLIAITYITTRALAILQLRNFESELSPFNKGFASITLFNRDELQEMGSRRQKPGWVTTLTAHKIYCRSRKISSGNIRPYPMLSCIRSSFYPGLSLAKTTLKSSALIARPLYRFSEKKPDRNDLDTQKTMDEKSPQKTGDGGYNYDPVRFQQINDESFLRKLKREEEERRRQSESQRTLGFRIPIFCCVLSLFLYYLWQAVPYSVVWKYNLFAAHTRFSNLLRHLTTSEYINQRGYVHAIFLCKTWRRADVLTQILKLLCRFKALDIC